MWLVECSPKFAIVGGWMAVEQQATAWSPTATVEEVEPRLWLVTDGIPIGMIGKAPWTVEEIERRAILACQGPAAVDPLDEVLVIAFEGTEQCRALLRWAEAHQITVTDGNECGDPACCGFITMRCRVPRHLIATLPSGWDWED